MRVTKRQKPGLDTGLKAPLEGAACAVSCSPRHEVDNFLRRPQENLHGNEDGLLYWLEEVAVCWEAGAAVSVGSVFEIPICAAMGTLEVASV